MSGRQGSADNCSHLIEVFADFMLPHLREGSVSCREFGPKVVLPNSVIRDLPKLFEAKQVPIRDGVKKLAVGSVDFPAPSPFVGAFERH